jgi:hypothetical protein
MLATSSIFATQQVHGVNSFLRDPSDPQAYVVVTITQHQEEEGSQEEAVIFRCQKCTAELARIDYDASPPGSSTHNPGQWGGSHDDIVPLFASVWGAVEATDRYNEETTRTCSQCGHVNDELPEPVWGWQRWVDQARVANRARIAMGGAADDALAPREAVQS